MASLLYPLLASLLDPLVPPGKWSAEVQPRQNPGDTLRINGIGKREREDM